VDEELDGIMGDKLIDVVMALGYSLFLRWAKEF